MAKKAVAGTLSDPTVNKVQFEAFGKTYHLCFDFNALAEAEAQTGLNILRCLDLSNLTATEYRAVLYAALLKFQPDMSLADAGNLIHPKTVKELTLALVKAYSNGEPEDEPKNVQEPEK